MTEHQVRAELRDALTVNGPVYGYGRPCRTYETCDWPVREEILKPIRAAVDPISVLQRESARHRDRR